MYQCSETKSYIQLSWDENEKVRSGRISKLTDEQQDQIRALLLKASPVDHGYNTASCTGPILIAWIKQQYHIEYKNTQIYDIIKSLGFSYQKGRGIYPEASFAEQEAFKEELKKTPARES